MARLAAILIAALILAACWAAWVGTRASIWAPA